MPLRNHSLLFMLKLHCVFLIKKISSQDQATQKMVVCVLLSLAYLSLPNPRGLGFFTAPFLPILSDVPIENNIIYLI